MDSHAFDMNLLRVLHALSEERGVARTGVRSSRSR